MAFNKYVLPRIYHTLFFRHDLTTREPCFQYVNKVSMSKVRFSQYKTSLLPLLPGCGSLARKPSDIHCLPICTTPYFLEHFSDSLSAVHDLPQLWWENQSKLNPGMPKKEIMAVSPWQASIQSRWGTMNTAVERVWTFIRQTWFSPQLHSLR